MQKPTISLREEQIAFFHREGHLAIPAITSPTEIERLIVVYDHLLAIRAGRADGNQYDLAGTIKGNDSRTLQPRASSFCCGPG